MKQMIPICFDLADLPEEERQALCREALRRGVPFEQVIREALIEKANQGAAGEKAA
jgi:hypothetical protein